MVEEQDEQNTFDLFLLSTVLFPRAHMGLRIFEPRYLDMVSRSLRHGKPFGICLATEDQGPDQVGTLAQIVDWQSENGLLLIEVEGMQRFTVQDWEWGHDVVVARVHLWPEEPKLPLAFEHAWVQTVLLELFDGSPPSDLDASTASMILAQALPLRSKEKQELLLLLDPLERLRRISAFFHRQRK
ncbi:MAG: LON peptidase substrate-binding domain-containing protein [Acidithiobacillus sp.]|nr:LON peptidase substrate-binding domain-containing protein [Acidithiobacillus sp.]